MGIHLYERGTVQRQTVAHLNRKENGDIYGVYKLSFKKDAKRYEYCFIGSNAGLLTFDGTVIPKHPKFKNIVQFENWCRRYSAEHDLTINKKSDV